MMPTCVTRPDFGDVRAHIDAPIAAEPGASWCNALGSPSSASQLLVAAALVGAALTGVALLALWIAENAVAGRAASSGPQPWGLSTGSSRASALTCTTFRPIRREGWHHGPAGCHSLLIRAEGTEMRKPMGSRGSPACCWKQVGRSRSGVTVHCTTVQRGSTGHRLQPSGSLGCTLARVAGPGDLLWRRDTAFGQRARTRAYAQAQACAQATGRIAKSFGSRPLRFMEHVRSWSVAQHVHAGASSDEGDPSLSMKPGAPPAAISAEDRGLPTAAMRELPLRGRVLVLVCRDLITPALRALRANRAAHVRRSRVRARTPRSRRVAHVAKAAGGDSGDPDPEPEPPGNRRCLPSEVAP